MQKLINKLIRQSYQHTRLLSSSTSSTSSTSSNTSHSSPSPPSESSPSSSATTEEQQNTLFNLLKNQSTDTVNIGNLLQTIEKSGIRRTDPRLTQLIENLREFHFLSGDRSSSTCENHNVDFSTFKSLTEPSTKVLHQVLSCDLIIPDFPTFSTNLQTIFWSCKRNRSGEVARYIPQLARYSPDYWAMSVCTVDGQRYCQGDVNKSFTVQSCSKPFTYAICHNELGEEVVNAYIGQEPSGRNFNEICLDSKKRPHNPMLNAGAIMSCSLVLKLIQPDNGLAEKYDFLLKYMKRIAGGEYIGFNNSVFLSERQTADRNFAMTYFMRENNCFPPNLDIHECLDLYFQTCSMEVNTESLCVMAATLANGGICPTTGERVLKSEAVRDVLSLMYSCGMYNYSGQFAFQVGLPAKSGVSGSVVLVVPNVMGVALWSPPLDTIGNSVRGIQFCEELVDLYNFHRFDNLRHSERKTDPRKRY